MWLQWAMVITAGVLFVVAGILGLILWVRNRREKRAKWSEIQDAAEEIKARRTHSIAAPDKLSVQQIREKIQQDKTHDPPDRHDTARAPEGKHHFRTEDDYPTKRIPRVQNDDPDQTVPFLPRVRPYLRLDRPPRGTWGEGEQ
jgi:cytoskeletal protein RodZ